MIVQCQKCQTKFRLDETRIPAEGSWVRCSKCRDIFQVLPPGQEAALAVPPAEDPTLSLSSGQRRQPSPAEDSADFGLDVDLSGKKGKGKKAKAESQGRGKGFKVLFWLLASLLILVILAAGGLVALDRLGLSPQLVDRFRNTPVLSLLLGHGGAGGEQPAKPAPEAEYKGLLLTQLRNYFRVNQGAGRLFVIQGLVDNQGKEERAAVMVRGRLTDNQGKVVRQEVIYAGQIFSPDDLHNLPLADIQGRLAKPEGPDGQKATVKAGATLPFMIVFANLPGNLAEFTVEVVGSEGVSAAAAPAAAVAPAPAPSAAPAPAPAPAAAPAKP